MNNSLIQERIALSEEEFIPREMVHRKPQLEEVKNHIQPVLEEESERYVVLHGPPGTGKTTLAKYLVNEMEDHVSPFSSAYVNSWQKYTRFSVLHGIVEQAGNYRITDKDLVSTDDLVDKIEEIKSQRPLIAIVDEVDLLQDSEALYDLAGGNVGLLLLCNDAETLWEIDARTRSRLGGNTSVKFPRYKHSEMLDILDRRQKVALRKDSLSREQLDWIADEAAGDARIGIRILRFAAERANSEGHDSIQDEDIEHGISEADSEYRRKNLSKLNVDQRLLYEILEEIGEIPPGRLYEVYEEKADRPKARRTIRRYINKMERYNLVETHGQTKAKTISITA